MWPDWIYEPLPYLYSLSGIVAAWQLDATLGRVSGVLLVSAGVVIWLMRYHYRKALRGVSRNGGRNGMGAR